MAMPDSFTTSATEELSHSDEPHYDETRMSGIDTPSEATPAPRPVSLLPTLLIGLVALIVAIVFLSSRSWYVTFLTVHILGVVIWIGGGLLLTLFGILAERTGDGEQLAQIARMAAFAGQRIFAPAALIVVIMGIAMVLNIDYGFGHFWLIFGLLGFATTFVLGIGVLGPMSKRADELIAEKGPNHPDVQALGSKLLLIARADIAMLLLVIVDMVTKPFS
jgi:uncharacterized membrane protein